MDINLKSALNPNTFFEHGWVDIPKIMIEEVISSSKKPCGKLEAMLIILLHVNYSGMTYNVNGKSVYCERGESIRSFSQWAEIFHWSRSTTKRFFMYLQDIGYLRFINDSQIRTHFIVLPYEELMTGPNACQAIKTPKKNTSGSENIPPVNGNSNSDNYKSNAPTSFKVENKKTIISSLQQKHQEFMVFWNRYFHITEKPRKNIGKAEREWNRLTPEEQRLALDNIGKYYYSQGNTKFTLEAANYLANKAYLNDFFIG